MVIACVYRLAADDADRVARLIAACDLPTSPAKIGRERWLELMGHDKKTVDGAMRFVLLQELGRAALFDRVGSADLAVLAG